MLCVSEYIYTHILYTYTPIHAQKHDHIIHKLYANTHMVAFTHKHKMHIYVETYPLMHIHKQYIHIFTYTHNKPKYI